MQIISQTQIPKFKIGDSIRALRDITFLGGAKHYSGFVYYINRDDVAYYNQNAKDYESYIRK